MKCIYEEIAGIAEKYLGIGEIGTNDGFNNKEFEQNMISVGWKREQAWCTYFAELVWKEAYRNYKQQSILNELDMLFSGSATATYNSFSKSNWEVGPIPMLGSIVIFQKYKLGKPTWMGHAGIVIGNDDKIFFSIEGNTGNGANNRDGDGIYDKKRPLDFSKKENGLVLINFIYPKQIV